MSQPLFRSQALARQRFRLEGEILLAQPLSLRVFSGLLLLIFLLLAGFLLSNDYHRRQTVRGVLMPDQGLLGVMVPQSGVVTALHVELGQVVAAGALLFELQPEPRVRDGEALSSLLEADLEAQWQLLEDRQRLLAAQAEGQNEQFRQRSVQTQDELKSLQRQIQLAEESLALTQAALERARRLQEKGWLAIAELERLRAEWLSAGSQLESLRRDRQSLHHQQENLQTDAHLARVQREEEQRGLREQQLQLQQQAARLRREDGLEIRAPMAGRVVLNELHTGQRLDAGQPSLAIVPEAAMLEARLMVPSAAIGLLQPGQSVKLRYEAFPYQKFGTFEATIVAVADAVVQEGAALEAGQPVYPVRARLQRQSLQAYGEEVLLRPGMQLSADIILERRSLMAWLLDPLLSLRGVI